MINFCSKTPILRTLARFSSTKKVQPNVVLKMLTKDNCQLCDEALEQIEDNLTPQLLQRFKIEKVDITEDEALFDRWRYEIPVFYLGNKFLCKNRIDIPKLKQKLEEE